MLRESKEREIFSEEKATRGYNDSLDGNLAIEEEDMIFEKWVEEQTDYTNDD